MLPAFRNESYTDFTTPANIAAFEAALNKIRAGLGGAHPLVINGQSVTTTDRYATINPSKPSEHLAYFSLGDASHADHAIEAARCAFETWQHVPVAERAGYLLRAAGEMRRRRHEFSAMMVLEVGKSWAEADADTAEAIDFLEYYARQAVELYDSSHKLTPYEGEHLSLHYLPLGVGAVIPPWNFPCAIACGMMSAAIVTGNTVVFKPAEQSPLIGWMVCQLFWDNGLPSGVLNFLTGPGHIVGARMVDHPHTRFIAFTGSREVGLGIYAKAGMVAKGQKWLKRAIMELGGKDAVVVDESADLEAAAHAIVASAFGFQGQKCSAGSRAIIAESVYDTVAARVIELTSTLTLGNPESSPTVYNGPVIDAAAQRKIMSYIETGKSEGILLAGGATVDTSDGGYFIQPTVFGAVDPNAKIAQDEIFGPVLALIKARDFDHALEIANDTDYGLTGAVFARDQHKLERAKREYHVGNLYLNRKCTGAMVGANPFGGFNMSGTDSKAGGPDYLHHFTQAKSTAERL